MKTKFFLLAAATFAFASALPVGAHAQSASAPAMSGDMKANPAPNTEMTEGEVRKIDADTKKITLKHGEIKNLGMPGMTMVFQVQDPAMLDTVKTGDKVRFNVEKAGGAMVITRIETAK